MVDFYIFFSFQMLIQPKCFRLVFPLQIIDHINKISTIRRCSFLSAASDIFSAKISGTFKRFGKRFFPKVSSCYINYLEKKILLCSIAL